MGLDLVVLQRENDDSPENWPGLALDARRADDPSPETQAELRLIYDNRYADEPWARAAEFKGWPPAPKITSVGSLLCFPLMLLIGWPVAWLKARAAKQRDDVRVRPSFEEWRAEQAAMDPPPVVLRVGPNCLPEAIPYIEAAVQWYGYRGKAVQPDLNPLVNWWCVKHDIDLNIALFGEQVEDGPSTLTDPSQFDELAGYTIGDMATMFEGMAADCAAAFPDLAAAADADNDEKCGPYPEHGIESSIEPFYLLAIRGAARFFRFWEGKGFPIAPDF